MSDHEILLNALRAFARFRASMLAFRSMRSTDVRASGGSEWLEHWRGQIESAAPDRLERAIHESIAGHRAKADALGATPPFLASSTELRTLDDLASALIMYPHGPAEDLTVILDELAAAMLAGGSLLIVVQADGRWSRVVQPVSAEA